MHSFQKLSLMHCTRVFLSIFLFFLVSGTLIAQENTIHSVYFDFDKHALRLNERPSLQEFIQDIDTTRIETIEILGYCDDRGKEDYNYKLSEKRAHAVRDFILAQGIKNKVIVNIEGKGRVMIDQDYARDISKLRQRNRRVDIVLNFMKIPFEAQPGIYTELNDSLREGDRVILQNIQFAQGRSRLTGKSRRELRRIARTLIKEQSDLNFEIHGHICCTPKRYTEAFDKDTHKRELSHNRAKHVYEFLLRQKIDSTRMKYFGCGNEYPLNMTPDLDRRVEFLIME